jgi:hypothetical protein
MVANDRNVPDSLVAHARSLEWLNLPSWKLSKLRQTLSHSRSTQFTIFQGSGLVCANDTLPAFVAMASVAYQSCEGEARTQQRIRVQTARFIQIPMMHPKPLQQSSASGICDRGLGYGERLGEFPWRPVAHQILVGISINRPKRRWNLVG